jgi:hypothetical protein
MMKNDEKLTQALLNHLNVRHTSQLRCTKTDSAEDSAPASGAISSLKTVWPKKTINVTARRPESMTKQ